MNTKVDGRALGRLVAAAGAATATASLWLAWYRLDVSDAFAQTLGEALAMDAWQAFETADVTMLVVALAITGFVVALTPGEAAQTGRLVSLAGGVVVLVALSGIVAPPVPEGLEVAIGPWVAVAGGLTAMAGGALIGRAADRASAAPPRRAN